MKIFNESGKGYWMEGFGCIRAEGENRPSRPGHVVVGCDLYNGNLTGDIACNMNANSNTSANHSGPTLLILNDQGGDIMYVSEEATGTLRAQDHGHPPVVCFEPGILSRDCSAGNRAYVDVCSTLRAQMGDNQPAICYEVGAFMGGQGSRARSIAYSEKVSPTLKSVMSGGNTIPSIVYPINLMVATRGGKDDMRTCFGIGEPDEPQFTLSAAHEHGVCYAVDSHPMDSRFRIDGGISGTVTTKLAKGSADGPLVIVENE